jgi:hypothetical protein
MDDTSVAVLVINNSDKEQQIIVDFSSVPGLKSCGENGGDVFKMRDIWTHSDLPDVSTGTCTGV